MKSYNVLLSSIIGWIFIAFIFMLIPIYSIIMNIKIAHSFSNSIGFNLFWLIILVGIFYFVASISYRITLNEDKLIFKTIFRKKEIKIEDITQIKLTLQNIIIIKYNGGKIRALNRINNLHELIYNIKNINSKIINIGI
jgi:hypothetical protein